jgi:two-component system sensor histidine kinase UhpB
MYRVARDKALLEIAERQRAEAERKKALQRLALLSRKAMAAQEDERARLSIEMHDELGQVLTALKLNIEFVQKRLQEMHDIPAVTLSSAIEMAEKATDELRRICKGLRPPLLDDLGLTPAIRLLAEEFREQSGIEVDLTLPNEDLRMPISEVVALSAYRILQESLTNVRRHARAKRVEISLSFSEEALTLSVRDDGAGFDMSGLGAQQGCGIEGMRERANLVEGRLEIRSGRSQGTRVVLSVPFLLK